MKISFLSMFTPMPENIRGISALPYWLFKYRDRNIQINIVSYNLNKISDEDIKKVEKSLDVSIVIVKAPFLYRYIRDHHLTFVRVFLKYNLDCSLHTNSNIAKLLTDTNPDVIWQYGYQFYKMVDLLPDYRHIVSDPDCPALTCFRQMADSSTYDNGLIKLLLYAKIAFSNCQTSKLLNRKNILHHFVGMGDLLLQREIEPEKQSFFLLHPHYDTVANPNINLQKDKIRILLAGANDFYMKTGINDLIYGLSLTSKDVLNKFEITFLGKNWDSVCKLLNSLGVEAQIQKWVDNYVESISTYDVQLAPITLGSGTKGKVLDGLANGLLMIGTPVAFENIAVRNMDSCVCYSNPFQIPSILTSIVNNRIKYENIARKGMYQVRTYHSPERLSKRIFDIMEKFIRDGSI